MSHLPPAALSIVFLVVVSGCTPGPLDSAAADVTLTLGDQTPLRLIHEPGLSEVRLTPPVGGVVELSFTYNDPLVDVTLRTNADEVSEGAIVTLPVEPSVLSLTVLYDDVEYRSDLSASALIDVGASGTIELQALLVDDETGAADVSALIDATLVSSDNAELRVEGFVEDGLAGDAP